MSKPYTGPSRHAMIISQLEQGIFVRRDGSVSPFDEAAAMEEQGPKAFRRLLFSQYKRLFIAVCTANLHRFVLNTFVTIPWPNWSAHAELLNLMTDWLRSKAQTLSGDSDYLPRAAVWTRERGKTCGLFTQMLVHVPYEVQDEFRIWLANATYYVSWSRDPACRKTSIPCPVYISPNFDRDTTSQWKLFRYMTNGLDAAEALQLLHDDHSRLLVDEFGEGFVPRENIEKWVGNTTSIGPQALKRLKHFVPVPTIWPKGASTEAELAYDDRFLLAGEKAWARANKGA